MIQTPRVALWWLIAVSFGLRLIWAAVLPMGHDEAYHYLFTVHPDWSYFDHPPMTMLIARLGSFILQNGEASLPLRFAFILLFAGSTWVLFHWTSRWYGEWAGFFAAFALNLTPYYTAAAGAFVLPDGPLLFFSMLTMWGLSEALVSYSLTPEVQGERGTSTWLWACIGLAWGAAMLSKYHAIFLPAAALLYILITPGARRCLLSPGPYLAALLGMILFSPVIIWNMQHGWASFAFQAGRAAGLQVRPDYLLTLLLGQLLYLFPWIWLGLVLVLFHLLRPRRTDDGPTGNARALERLLLCLSLVPLSFFLAVSLVSVTMPHWSLVGFLPLYPCLGARWSTMMATRRVWGRLSMTVQSAVILLMATTFGLQACLGLVTFPKDPTLQVYDWAPVARELEARGLVGRPGTFLFTRCWFHSGHLAFALHNRVPVLCFDTDSRGFAYWSRPDEWLGQDGIFVCLGDSDHGPQDYASYFRRIEEVASFPATRNGQPIYNARVFLCVDQIRPFPFRRPTQAPAPIGKLAAGS